jgi:hypothetical protein
MGWERSSSHSGAGATGKSVCGNSDFASAAMGLAIPSVLSANHTLSGYVRVGPSFGSG